MEQTNAKIEVIFTSQGIDVVRVHGAGLDDHPIALLNRLLPWLRQIHAQLQLEKDPPASKYSN